MYDIELEDLAPTEFIITFNFISQIYHKFKILHKLY